MTEQELARAIAEGFDYGGDAAEKTGWGESQVGGRVIARMYKRSPVDPRPSVAIVTCRDRVVYA